MRSTIFLFALLFPFIANTQTIPVNFNDCHTDYMFVSSDIEPQWKSDTISLIDFLNQHITDENLVKIKEGRILIGIMIYPDGKTCCHSFGNLTQIELNPEIIREAVDKMPNWIPAKQSGKEITFLKNQLFTIRNGKFVQ